MAKNKYVVINNLFVNLFIDNAQQYICVYEGCIKKENLVYNIENVSVIMLFGTITSYDSKYTYMINDICIALCNENYKHSDLGMLSVDTFIDFDSSAHTSMYECYSFPNKYKLCNITFNTNVCYVIYTFNTCNHSFEYKNQCDIYKHKLRIYLYCEKCCPVIKPLSDIIEVLQVTTLYDMYNVFTGTCHYQNKILLQTNNTAVKKWVDGNVASVQAMLKQNNLCHELINTNIGTDKVYYTKIISCNENTMSLFKNLISTSILNKLDYSVFLLYGSWVGCCYHFTYLNDVFEINIYTKDSTNSQYVLNSVENIYNQQVRFKFTLEASFKYTIADIIKYVLFID